MNEQTFTVKEAAHRLGASDETVRRMILEGIFPGARKLRPEKNTSPYRIPKSELDAYLQARDEKSILKSGQTPA